MSSIKNKVCIKCKSTKITKDTIYTVQDGTIITAEEINICLECGAKFKEKPLPPSMYSQFIEAFWYNK